MLFPTQYPLLLKAYIPTPGRVPWLISNKYFVVKEHELSSEYVVIWSCAFWDGIHWYIESKFPVM